MVSHHSSSDYVQSKHNQNRNNRKALKSFAKCAQLLLATKIGGAWSDSIYHIE